jgi:LAO/AO transport system kinase
MEVFLNNKTGIPRVDEAISWMKERNIRGLTRAISIVENNEEGRDALLNDAFKRASGACFTLGFTGAPGVGKSTLVNAVIRSYRRLGKTVGVMAVDPTSPFSGGAVLGDRIRMQEHNPDSGVFIRSLASRKALGGLSEATKFALYLYKAFGFDVIIVETLGVGQDEIDVARFVDITTVLLVPGYGDTIQMAKAGIMEIADLFVINKSDRPGADLLKKQVENILYMKAETERPAVLNTVADQNLGIDAVMEAIEEVRRRKALQGREHHRKRIVEEIRSSVLSRLATDADRHLEEMAAKVLTSSMTPIEAAEEIIRRIRQG